MCMHIDINVWVEVVVHIYLNVFQSTFRGVATMQAGEVSASLKTLVY